MATRVLSVAFVLSALLTTGAARAADPASPAPATPEVSAVPAPTVDPGITARAKEWLHRFQTGDIDHSQLSAQVNAALTPDIVKQVSGQLAPLGDPQTFVIQGQQSLGDGAIAYVYHVTFKSSAINEVFELDKDGKIAGIRFQPSQ
jgi:hypothetical protein